MICIQGQYGPWTTLPLHVCRSKVAQKPARCYRSKTKWLSVSSTSSTCESAMECTDLTLPMHKASLFAIRDQTSSQPYFAELQVNNHFLHIKVDMGATVFVASTFVIHYWAKAIKCSPQNLHWKTDPCEVYLANYCRIRRTKLLQSKSSSCPRGKPLSDEVRLVASDTAGLKESGKGDCTCHPNWRSSDPDCETSGSLPSSFQGDTWHYNPISGEVYSDTKCQAQKHSFSDLSSISSILFFAVYMDCIYYHC